VCVVKLLVQIVYGRPGTVIDEHALGIVRT